MVGQRQRTEDQLGTARLVADTTCILLQRVNLPSTEIPKVMQALHDIVAGDPQRASIGSEAILPAVIAAIQDARPTPAVKARGDLQPARASRPRRWTPVAPTNTPVTPIQRLEAALRRSPLRLDDRTAMAIARASGKPIGRDKLEAIQQVENRMALTFGFDFGSAKFTAEFDVYGDLGGQAMAALMDMLDAGD